ncbi:MAG: GatB/YqeY domain-containing protein, partial [Clostridia bacterium]|nr:GatB/YqeY domain-containing protein [Clostridia bacterium]
LVADLNREIEVLMAYLPEQMSEAEVEEIVKAAIAETGASGMKEMGKVMAAVMPKTKGRADGKLVNTLVKKLLS